GQLEPRPARSPPSFSSVSSAMRLMRRRSGSADKAFCSDIVGPRPLHPDAALPQRAGHHGISSPVTSLTDGGSTVRMPSASGADGVELAGGVELVRGVELAGAVGPVIEGVSGAGSPPLLSVIQRWTTRSGRRRSYRFDSIALRSLTTA